MPDLTFRVTGAAAANGSVSLAIEIDDRAPGANIESINLRCQIQIEAARRRYSPDEQSRLIHLFGEPERWGQTLRPMLWANVSTDVPAFTGATSVQINVPCSSDTREAPTRYFQSLDGGIVLITLLFSGMIFYRASDGRRQVAPIPWDREARFEFPVDVWKQSIASKQSARAIEVGA